jgi:hypothetical protein
MIPSVAGGDEKKYAWIKPYIERLVIMFKSSEIQQWMEVFLIDPVIHYVMNRFFAYVVIALVAFGALLVFVILTFIILIMRSRNNGHMCINCSNST